MNVKAYQRHIKKPGLCTIFYAFLNIKQSCYIKTANNFHFGPKILKNMYEIHYNTHNKYKEKEQDIKTTVQ